MHSTVTKTCRPGKENDTEWMHPRVKSERGVFHFNHNEIALIIAKHIPLWRALNWILFKGFSPVYFLRSFSSSSLIEMHVFLWWWWRRLPPRWCFGFVIQAKVNQPANTINLLLGCSAELKRTWTNMVGVEFTCAYKVNQLSM